MVLARERERERERDREREREMYPVFDKAVPQPLAIEIDIGIHWAKPGGKSNWKTKMVVVTAVPHPPPP